MLHALLPAGCQVINIIRAEPGLKFHWLLMVASAGTIPADIGNSRFLRYLYLMNNNLTGMLPAISCTL
jgi:hypothetical protein